MRLHSIGVVALAAVFLLAVEAAAIDVTVKTDTKLYGRGGTVLADVAPGRTFKAERLVGEWVYGFLPSATGGAGGWIRADALELDDEARGKLEAAGATQPTTPSVQTTPAKPTKPTETVEPTVEPTVDTPDDGSVLLRYTLGQNQLQVYQATQQLHMSVKSSQTAIPVDGSASDSATVVLSLRGKGRAPDGTIAGEVRFHDLQFERRIALGPETTRLEGDENGATLYRNGKREHSGKWGSAKLGQAPNFSKLLITAYSVRISERGEVKLGSVADKIKETDLELILGGKRIFPKGPVRPGDSWTSPVSHEMDDPTGADEETTIVGTAKYTLLERVVHRGRRCAKIGMTAVLKSDAESPLRIEAKMSGTSLVDELTGIPINSKTGLTMTMAGTVMGVFFEGSGSANLSVEYKGNKLR